MVAPKVARDEQGFADWVSCPQMDVGSLAVLPEWQ